MASRRLCRGGGGGGGGGQIVPLYNWYNHLNQEGNKYGYLVNGSKSWLVVKSDVLADEAKRVFGDELNVTTEGQRHLGAVIGSSDLRQLVTLTPAQGGLGVTPTYGLRLHSSLLLLRQ